jgi:hypothetical protein
MLKLGPELFELLNAKQRSHGCALQPACTWMSPRILVDGDASRDEYSLAHVVRGILDLWCARSVAY